MEFIWTQISINDSESESPAWHKDALAETERRYEASQEELIDWNEAKELLRKQYRPEAFHLHPLPIPRPLRKALAVKNPLHYLAGDFL